VSIERVLCDRYAYVVDSSYSSTNVSYFAPGVVISTTQCACIVNAAAPLYKAPVATLLSGNYRLRTSITTSPTDITIYGWDGGNYIYVIPVGVSGLTPGECGLLGVDLGVDSAGKILLDSEI